MFSFSIIIDKRPLWIHFILIRYLFRNRPVYDDRDCVVGDGDIGDTNKGRYADFGGLPVVDGLLDLIE